jgi:hypothetical protein
MQLIVQLLDRMLAQHAMILKCPHCSTDIHVSELRRQPSTGGGLECPVCKGMVRFAQPHALFRRALSLSLSVTILLIVGVHKPLILAIGSILLWLPISILVNMYCVYVMPLGLQPWKPRGRRPFAPGPIVLFQHRLISDRGRATRCPPGLVKFLLVVGAAVSLVALSWLVGLAGRRPSAFRSLLFWLGITAASTTLLLLWSTIVGFLSHIRMWSPQWTFLAGAMPFWILGIWTFFFSSLEMRLAGYTIMLVIVCFGSFSGHQARKIAYPQFSHEHPPSASLPPPTLFPK